MDTSCSFNEDQLLFMCAILVNTIKDLKSASNISIEDKHKIEIYNSIIKECTNQAPNLFKLHPYLIDAGFKLI